MPTSKCFIRYNDGGNPYKVCIDKTKANKKVWDKDDRKPSYQTKSKFPDDPKISAGKFLQKIADSNPKVEGYEDLTPEQTRTYHRLDMRIRRAKEKVENEDKIKDLKSYKKELKENKRKEVEELKKTMSVKTSNIKDVKALDNDTEIKSLVSKSIRKWDKGKGSFTDLDLAILKKQLGRTAYKQFIANTINSDVEKTKSDELNAVSKWNKVVKSSEGKKAEKDVFGELKDLAGFIGNINMEIKDANDEGEKAKKILLKKVLEKKERIKQKKKVKEMLKNEQNGVVSKVGAEILEDLLKDLNGAYNGKRPQKLKNANEINEFLDTPIKDYIDKRVVKMASGILPGNKKIQDILMEDKYIRGKVQKYLDMNKEAYKKTGKDYNKNVLVSF